MLIDKKERIDEVYHEMTQKSFFASLKVLKYDSTDYQGYSYLKIYNHNATKNNMTDYLTKMFSVERVITFGSIEGKYTYTINNNEKSPVIKLIERI